jgi:hypothetical protein
MFFFSTMADGLSGVLALVITPVCLSFFYEFSAGIYKPTAASLNSLTFGKKGEYLYPAIFTGINYLLQIHTTPIWTKIAQRDSTGRRNAIVASLMAILFPNLVVLIAIGVNSTDTVMVYKSYLVANAFSGVFGLPVALAFAIAKFDRHSFKQTQTQQNWDEEEDGREVVDEKVDTDMNKGMQLDPLFIVMLSVPAGILAGQAMSSDTPRIGYAAVWAICASILSCALMFIDNRFNYNRKQALSAAEEEASASPQRGAGSFNADGGEDVTRNSVVEVSRDMVSKPILLKYIKNRSFVVLAVPLALLQFGHEAFFALTGTHIFELLVKKLGKVATKAFIGVLFRTGALCNMFALLVLPWFFRRYCNLSQLGIASAGMSSAATSYLFYGIAKTEALLWVAELCGFCVLLAKPALASALIATAAASATEEGEITGAFFAMGHIGSIAGLIIGAVMFTAIGQESYYVLMAAPLLALCVLGWERMQQSTK